MGERQTVPLPTIDNHHNIHPEKRIDEVRTLGLDFSV